LVTLCYFNVKNEIVRKIMLFNVKNQIVSNVMLF